MTRFFKYALMTLALCVGFASCSKNEDYEPQPQQLIINYANFSGIWQLVSYNGHQLEEGTYLYIDFIRRDHVFRMYDNLQSMYGQKRTGTYYINEYEKTETMVLSGIYDNGVGGWNDEYTISSLTEKELRLTTRGDNPEIQIYNRLDKLPEGLEKEEAAD